MKIIPFVDRIGTKNDEKITLLKESFPGENRADKILFAARDRIIEGGVFYGTPETRAAEDAVNRTYKAIMNGGKDFSALYIACNQWVEAAKKPPEQMAIETLVGVSGK